MTGNTFYFHWEVTLMIWLQAHLGTAGAKIAEVITCLGEEVVYILIFGILYFCLNKKAAKDIGKGLVIALVANPMIKNIALRRRPYFDHPQIRCIRPVKKGADLYDIAAQGYSFPSGHAMYSMEIYGSLYFLCKNRALRVLTAVLPVLIGISRVALGVHYPTDVLGGWAIGLLILLLFPVVKEKTGNENLFHLVVFAVSALGIFYCRTNDYFTALGVMGGFYLAIPIEERFVSFEDTDRMAARILRVAGGIAAAAVLSTLTKMPFSGAFLESGTLAACLVRTARYAVLVFVLFAVYPMCFPLIDKVTGKRDT